MPPKVDQSTLIVLDIGRNVNDTKDTKEESFFSKAKGCASRLIERKIMSKGKNLLGVILLGSKRTKNNMAEMCAGGAFRKIELMTELQTPTWQMIRDLPETPSNSQGDWLEAVVVAADHFKNGVSGVTITNKKIVLMTNFQAPTQLEVNDIERVLTGLKEDNLEVDVIGPDIYDENQKGNDFELARQFVETTNGTTAHFEDTMRYLLFHRKKITKPMPWNVDLSIGPNLKIPVSAYLRLKDEPVIKSWIRSIKDPVSLKASASEAIVREKVHINTENQTVVEPTEVITGYNYGQQIIPFNDCDKTMLYDSGDKCLSVYGFTHANNITWQNLAGSGLHYIFGRKGSKKAQNAVRCLVECLQELNLVGIVRRVYNRGNAPKMFALMPVIDTNNYICLSMAAVCFKEEIKIMSFPPTNLKKYSCTTEQVDAFKDLIKAMDLTKAYDETFDDAEAFPIAETVSPSAQYVLDCIAFRAMNPGKPLPQPRDDIMQLFKEPPLIEKKSREPLDKIKKLFTLNKVEVKTKSRKRDDAQIIQFDNLPIKTDDPIATTSNQTNGDHDVPKVQLPKKSDDITRIGTANPINDFKALVDKGKTLADLSPEIADAIENLFYCNLDGNYSKAMMITKFFREECVKDQPSFYNEWLQKFKRALIDRKKDDVLNLLEKNLNLILKEENSLSSYDANNLEDSQLYYIISTIPNSTEFSIRSEVNNMFDEM